MPGSATDPRIPDKQYFKIGEVAKVAGVRPSVLRFWETEFPSLRPEKSRSNQRLYSRRHVERVLQIKELLYERKYTIAGARKRLREGAKGEDGAASARLADRLADRLVERLKKELRELLRLVDG
jgi:DNA-binding transcriptional MerR regulator